jgi:hypothetical protein
MKHKYEPHPALADDSFEAQLARTIYEHLLKNGQQNRNFDWGYVRHHYEKILSKIEHEKELHIQQQQKERMRAEGWVIYDEAEAILGEFVMRFAERNSLLRNREAPFGFDGYGSRRRQFYNLEEVKAKKEELISQYNDEPNYSSHKMAEKLGISPSTFLAWTKKMGIEPAGHYYTPRGRGNLYSINQLNKIIELRKGTTNDKRGKGTRKTNQ